MSDNDTPRTDAELRKNGAHVETVPGSTSPFVDYDFACTLERELAAARAELAEARECLREMCDKVPIDIQWALSNPEVWKRWRKVAGLDAVTPTHSGNS